MQNLMSKCLLVSRPIGISAIHTYPLNFKNYHHSLIETFSLRNAFKNSKSAVFCETDERTAEETKH